MGIKNVIKNMPNFIKGGGGITEVKLSFTQGSILSGKNVLITGGSSGIGYAIAKKCLSSGAQVIITGRNKGKLDSAIENLSEIGDVFAVSHDVGDISSLNEKAEEILKHFNNKIDGLVNNAGIAINHKFFDVTEEEYDRIFNICLKGPYFLTRRLFKSMIDANIEGSIIMISSNGAIIGHTIPYGIAKSGINNYCEGLAKAGSQYGIRCNAIMPGYTATSISDEFKKIDVNANVYKSNIRGKRWHLPEEIAEIVAFLLSDNSKCVTGQLIACDSGDTIR